MQGVRERFSGIPRVGEVLNRLGSNSVRKFLVRKKLPHARGLHELEETDAKRDGTHYARLHEQAAGGWQTLAAAEVYTPEEEHREGEERVQLAGRQGGDSEAKAD